MANRSRRIAPQHLAKDEDDYAALKVVADYAPANSDYTVAAIEQAYQELQAARTAEAQADAAAKAARDKVVEKQLNFHGLMLGARDQVTAQFGRDSNQAQAVGRKKPSEYKKPQRKSKKGSGEGTEDE
ncbi:MAG: hypothetical protein JOZ02_15265 [Acidobacteria bacterium]|nr:hypothetical protein [Acidobacteriota bacterium]